MQPASVNESAPPAGGRASARRSVLWSAAENLGLMLISFGSLVLYSRVLTAAEFGSFSVVLALVELIDVAVRMLFHDALVQRKNVTALHFDTAFTVTVVLSLVGTVACLAFAPLFAVLVDSPPAGKLLAWMTLCFPFGAITATIVAQQRRDLSFKALALRSLCGRMVGALIGVGLVLAGAGAWGLVAQQVLIAAVGSMMLWFGAAARPRFRFGMRELRDLCGFGLLSLGTVLLNFAARRIFTILAGLFLGVGAAGVLNLSMRTVDTLYSLVATAVAQVVLPMLSSMQADKERLHRVFKLVTALNCAVLYGLFFGLAALAPEVVQVMFGDKWHEAALYVALFASVTLVQGPNSLMGPLLTAIGRPADPMTARLVELVFIVALMLLSRTPSPEWAAGIWVAREVISFPLMIWLVWRATSFSVWEQLRGIAKPLAAALGMVAAIVVMRAQFADHLPMVPRLLVLCLAGAVTYVGALTLLDRPLVRELMAFARVASKRTK